MKRKIAALLLAGVLAGTGCQGGIVLAAETTTETEAPAETEEASEAASEAEAETMSEEERTEAAAQLLTDLTGSYTQLWDVLLADDYKDEWLNDCKAIVGDDDAEAAVEMLQASVTGLAMTAAAKLLSEQRSPENDRKRYQAFLASAGEKHD